LKNIDAAQYANNMKKKLQSLVVPPSSREQVPGPEQFITQVSPKQRVKYQNALNKG
jgi:hypothetical protein